ncbi:MAG: PH domain-containing protein [Candidatus Yanofskybacteria bacterium]|nr:PH domain-containing protein [Candidatus Yanofskybacteria bacterium]
MPIILRQDEELIKIARKHVMFLIPVFFTWPLIVVGLFLVRYSLDFDFFGYWTLTLILSALIVTFIILQKCFIWKNDALIITNQRVVENEQHGFFSKTVTELLYQDIVEITYSKRGMNASLYDYGDLKIRTAAENEIILEKIANPDETIELINNIRQNRSTI